ncbi:MAG: hypothetical protein AVDCRST_MAG73-1012, partial [uncultured Thermomicrobiales bacterium]
RDRAGAIAWAHGLMTSLETVFLDTETTGLGGEAEVIEVGVVGADGTVLLDTMVRPHGPIPAVASAVHGIFADDVRNAPGWAEVHTELERLLRGRAVVVYNAPFDRQMVAQCCVRWAVAEPEATWHCAMRAFAVFYAEPGVGRGGGKWHKLERAAVLVGATAGGHRALGDALACRAVVAAMAATEDAF